MEFVETMDFIGEYQFINTVTIPGGLTFILWKSKKIKNLITNAGRTLFINRIGSNTNGPITHIAVGTGTTEALITQTSLINETVRLPVSSSVAGTPNWNTVFSVLFTALQINGTSEIALLNASSGGIMATRSKYTTMSIPSGSNLTIVYTIGLVTFTIITGFTLTSGKTKTYQLTLNSSSAVRGVIESDTKNGYEKETSTASVEAQSGSYWHDTANNLLYIHTTNDTDPINHILYVQIGG